MQDGISPVRLDQETMTRLGRQMTRQTAAYRPSISIIEILLAAQGLSLEDGERGPGGESAILYPTTAPEAEEEWIEVRDPVAGGGRARVVLRPVDLYKLRDLISDGRARASRERGEYARRLAFGD